MNNLKEKYNDEYLKELDKNHTFIPLTRDYMFKAIMTRNIDQFKDFLIKTMNINIKSEDSYILFLDKELIKENYKEHGKIVDINIKIGKDLIIDVEVNRNKYSTVKEKNDLYLDKLSLLEFEVGDKYQILKNKYLYQLNLNANINESKKIYQRIIVEYDLENKEVFDTKRKKFIRNLVNYKNMYYNKTRKMTYDEIFMAGLMSESFTELYNIMKNILSDDKLNELMESVIEMSEDWILLHEWQKEKMDKMVQDNIKREEEEERKKELYKRRNRARKNTR